MHPALRGPGRALAIVISCVLLAAPVANAQEPTTTLDPDVVARAVEEYLARRGEDGASPWQEAFRKLSLSGDLRLRHESSVERDGQDDRHRERLRLRLGASYQVHEDLSIGARLITGDADDPNSPHTTLGDVFDSEEISLDRIYARYTPECWEGSWIVAGKFGHPFATNPVYGELVWDADVQPEGIAGGYRWQGSGALTRVDAVAGQYILLEQGNASDTSMSVAQIAAVLELSEELQARSSVGYYHYNATSPDGSLAIVGDNQGNQTLDRDADGTADAFDSEFGVVDAVLAFTHQSGDGLPITVAGELIRNVRTGDRAWGWALGAALGSTANPGDWKLYYQWQLVDQEAVFSPFAQDDFLLATNHRSHLFGVQYAATKAITLHAWTLASRREHTGTTATTDSDSTQWNLRFDVNIRF